jgi:hypothetical protein
MQAAQAAHPPAGLHLVLPEPEVQAVQEVVPQQEPVQHPVLRQLPPWQFLLLALTMMIHPLFIAKVLSQPMMAARVSMMLL